MNTVRASTASAGAASFRTTASSCAPSRSSKAITATSPRSSSAAIYDEAARLKGDTSENLIGLLERRLDAIVYRAKFVPTVFAARQFVSHGHVRVNGRRVTIPSYRCREGDVIEVRDKAKDAGMVLEAAQSPERDVPEYLEVDHSKMTAKLVRVADAFGCALSGDDGAEPRHRVLLALMHVIRHRVVMAGLAGRSSIAAPTKVRGCPAKRGHDNAW